MGNWKPKGARGTKNSDTMEEAQISSVRGLPSASAGFQHLCGRKTGDGKWEIWGKTGQNCPNSRNRGGIGQIFLPSAPVSFRGRLATVVTLVSDIHLVDGVGKLGDGGGILVNWKPKGAKTPKTRIPGRKIKFLASVCFRGVPRASSTCVDGRRKLGNGKI